MRKRRAVTLVLTLFLSALLLIAGLAYLSQREAEARWSQGALDAIQARTLAEAGLEEARLKLGKLHAFPPFSGEQKQFEYSEDVLDFAGQRLGTYTVLIDSRLADPVGPYQVIRIESVGRLGDRGHPKAQRTLYAELDVAPLVRGNNTANPKFFQWIDFQDRGGF